LYVAALAEVAIVLILADGTKCKSTVGNVDEFGIPFAVFT
jgi:hypothetical protein